MIDMNQSIENIMEECDRIAFNEFKSDIDLYNKERIAAAKQSGQHKGERGAIDYSKRASRTRDYGTGTNFGRRNDDSQKPRTKDDKRDIDIDNRVSSKNVDDNLYARRAYREYNKQHPDEIKKSAQDLRKMRNEAVSIFDYLFQAIDE